MWCQGQAQKAASAGPLHVMLEGCAAACLPRRQASERWGTSSTFQTESSREIQGIRNLQTIPTHTYTHTHRACLMSKLEKTDEKTQNLKRKLGLKKLLNVCYIFTVLTGKGGPSHHAQNSVISVCGSQTGLLINAGWSGGAANRRCT
jgi:hypothetical protein